MINNKQIPITVILLAGGKSSRIGWNKDKGKMKLLGVNLVDRVIKNITDTVGFLKRNIIIVGPKDKYPGYKRVFEDIYPGKGPLGGIFTGLRVSKTNYNLIIGCDMPFIEGSLIRYMIKNISGYDIIIPSYKEGLFEPLCAIYSKNCLEIIEKNIKMGKLTIRDIFPFLKIKLITEEEIRQFDPALHSFFNINFKKDFIRAEELEKRRNKNCC